MRQPSPASAATPPSYPPASYAWYVVGVLVLATVLSYTDRQILSLLVDPMRRDLRISDTQMGLLMGSAFAFVYGIAGITLWSIGTVCCGLAADFTQFFGARLLVGVGEAVLTPASVAIISDSFP